MSMQSKKVSFKEDFHKIKFKCKKCGRCCENSKIRLSPYDILRLCKRLNISTTELHQKFSYLILDKENQNLLTCRLKTSPKCNFLEEDGCTIYEDRPFGCRIYPLATQPFFDGEQLKNEFYILEKCLGFDTNKKISVGEYKKNQNLDQKELYDNWVKFKVMSINLNLPQNKEYHSKFFTICYDFDNNAFKDILKQLNLEWPEDIKERHKIIIKLANKILLEPFM